MLKQHLISCILNYNQPKEFIPVYIGQGYGYKNCDINWNTVNCDEVLYIPEYGYVNDDEISIDSIYTKRDFIDVAKGNESDARCLYDFCDWQYPETAYEEWKQL